MQTSRPLSYRSAATERDPRHWTLIWIISLIAGAVFLGLLVWSVHPSALIPPKPVPLPPAIVISPSPGIAPGVVPAGDSRLAAAAAAAGKTLDGLLRGNSSGDPNLRRFASWFQNFGQWAITSASKTTGNPASVTFAGNLTSGEVVSLFTIQMVEQADGTWKAGRIIGPGPQ